MDITEAFQIVLEVAKTNAAKVPEGTKERVWLEEANKLVEDYIVNKLGDD